MDVKFAFLNGVPEEELYIFPPQGLMYHLPNTVLKLNKSFTDSSKVRDAGTKP
jgi:hypothetical protein